MVIRVVTHLGLSRAGLLPIACSIINMNATLFHSQMCSTLWINYVIPLIIDLFEFFSNYFGTDVHGVINNASVQRQTLLSDVLCSSSHLIRV